jgi:post-segregation antitoxin (ccd killing protein)
MTRIFPAGIREPAYVRDAPRQTVSLTINSDLFARIKALGINASRVAEEALVQALESRRVELTREELKVDLAAYEAFVAKHGSFASMARAHYQDATDEDAV